MKKLSALIVLALFASPAAFAQGTSCATAIPLTAPSTVNTDTTGGTGWINNYGPLASPSNDIVYTFGPAATAPTGSLTPTASSYQFGLYLLSSCAAGAGPTPIGTTATIGTPINLTGITSAGVQYYVAVTGVPAGGPGANGTLTWDVAPTLPVTLESFEIN